MPSLLPDDHPASLCHVDRRRPGAEAAAGSGTGAGAGVLAQPRRGHAPAGSARGVGHGLGCGRCDRTCRRRRERTSAGHARGRPGRCAVPGRSSQRFRPVGWPRSPTGSPTHRPPRCPTAGMTALRALEVAGLVLGKRVLVTGATGGVGRIAIQLARESGAHVTALVRDAGGSARAPPRSRRRRRRREPRRRLRLDHRRSRRRDVRPRHRARRRAWHRRQHRDPERRRDVTFQAARFDRAKGARIYTLNLPDELALPRQRRRRPRPPLPLMAEGRLDGQIELEASWRDACPLRSARLLDRRIGGKAVLHCRPSSARSIAETRNVVRKSGGSPRCESPSRPSTMDLLTRVAYELHSKGGNEMRRITRSRSLLLAVVAAAALASTGSGSAAVGEDRQRHGRSRFHDRTDHAGQEGHETEGRRLVPLRHQ